MDTAKLLSSVPTGVWIGGEERAGSSTFNVLNPATDEVLVSISNATPEDGIAALDAAAGVQKEWVATPPRERGEILRSVFEAITARAEEFATLMTQPTTLPAAIRPTTTSRPKTSRIAPAGPCRLRRFRRCRSRRDMQD